LLNRGYRERRVDRSSTIVAVRDGNAWIVTERAARASRHERRRTAGTESWDVENVELAGTGTPDDTAATRLREAVAAIDACCATRRSAVRLTVVVCRRSTEAGDDEMRTVELCHYLLDVQHADGQTARAVLASAAEIGRHYARLATGSGPAARGIRPPHRASVLLSSAVAGAVLHELIGHAVEEGDLPIGRAVLPSGTYLTVEPARDDAVDDEGVPTRRVNLVRNGHLVRAMHDRLTAGRSGRPSGHSWCGPHADMPRLRLTHLRAGGPRRAVDAAHPLLWCAGITGAVYSDGIATLHVPDAVLLTGGRDPVGPVVLRLGAEDLTRMCFVDPAGWSVADVPGRPGACVKGGDVLPSQMWSLPSLVEDVTLWALS
jgi:hypothetical protein